MCILWLVLKSIITDGKMLNCVTGISWSTLRRRQRRRQSPLQFPSYSLCQCLLWVGGCPVEVEKEVEAALGDVEGKLVEVLKKGGGCLASVV